MVIITGASAGIGESVAKAFAREGRELLLLARRKDRLEALAKKLHSEFKAKVHTFRLDVTDRKAVEDWASEQAALIAQADVLVNNAGLAKGLGTIQDGNPDDWDVMIDTNIKGFLYVTRAVVPFFVHNKVGHVVNIGSVAGRWAYPKGNVYAATKSAVRMLNETMRLDLNGTGIRVTEIAPGMAKTEFSLVRLGDFEKADAVYSGLTPLTGDDIAETVVWAVSRPSHVNIQEIVIYPTDQASTTLINRRK
jgi:3-hydroxy acid dehydrogenase / malonic semialdehyde reductase